LDSPFWLRQFNESVKETAGRCGGLSVFSDSYEYYAPEKAVIAITGWFKRARKPIARLSCHEKNRYVTFAQIAENIAVR
jgi:hypothetical protein